MGQEVDMETWIDKGTPDCKGEVIITQLNNPRVKKITCKECSQLYYITSEA